MTKNETFICCHFQSETTFGTLLGFPFRTAGKVANLKLACYNFLKTLNLRQNLLSRVIQILFTGMYDLIIPLLLQDSPVYKFHFATKGG